VCAGLEERKEMMAKVQNLKETIHKHFKDWVILYSQFHHDMRMHQDVTVAIAVICQIALQRNEEDLFEVEYSDQMTEEEA
jgi:hypothetical protein